MEKTASFHSQVHKITVFLLSKSPTDTIREKLYEQLCLPAVMWRRFAGLQGRTPILSSAFVSPNTHFKERRRDLNIIGVKVAAAREPPLQHLWQCCLLLSCCSDLLLPPNDELVLTLTRQDKELEDTCQVS